MVSNWKCVVENIQYLRKTSEKTNSKIDLTSEPKVHELIGLRIHQVEKLLKDVCTWIDEEKIENGWLWMYSLLALHQSLAPYTMFEELGDINYILSTTDTMESRVVKIILREHFHQRHLKIN